MVGAKALEEEFGVGRREAVELARMLKNAYGDHEAIDEALEEANKVLGGFGVEAIQGNFSVSSYYRDIVALYINRGETYETTILYETAAERFRITSWGDWVERNQEKYEII